jgi:iron complex outermembrane recepter protein
MLAKRPTGAFGPLAFLNAFLMASAFALPAYAQIESVVVTAEKKAEDIQTVPISVTALTGEDLSSRQITTFQDLQFNVPSVTNSKTNFTSSNFEIRGIGASGTGAAVESGVAFNVNDFYLNSPAIAETEYYDLDRIEVLRGPQSTLYGRNATGGSVNVITAKPDLESFGVNAEAEYGNYNDVKIKGAVNIPLIDDKLAFRASGLFWNRDGTTTNLFDNSHVDSRNQWSARGELRFVPSSDTTIDLMVQASSENSSRMRSQKSMCDFDPSGILGCLPDKLAYNTPNLNSTLGNISAAPQTFAAVFGELPSSLQGYYDAVATSLGVTAQPGLTPGGTLFAAMGLGQANLQAPQTSGLNPADMHTINTDFNPKYTANELLITAQWKQRITDWLDATLLGGYQHAGLSSEQSYYNTVGDPIIYSQTQINLINGMAALPGGGFSYNTAPLSNFSLMHPTSIGGGLYTLAVPVSAFDSVGSAGTIGGRTQGYSDRNSLNDKSDGWGAQKSVELRFNSDLSGPVNFMVAGYYLSYDNTTDYFVAGPAVDYAGLMLGALALPVTNLLPPGSTPNVPMAAGPAYYWNAERYSLTSMAAFGEVYVDIVPDLLKLTVGLRETMDRKQLTGRTTLYNAFVPVGTSNLDSPVPYIATTPFGGLQGPTAFATELTKNTATTGRAVLNYTPKLSFTEQTMFYASYSRGYKAGGSNPPLPAGAPASLANYKPEFVDSFEVGTKNVLLGGTLQANADVWYYDYKALQVSAILDKDAINENVDAKMWGIEGEFLWAPDDNWQFNVSFANNHSSIGNSSLSNPRNPTYGDPNATLIKDLGTAETCVVTNDPGYLPWTTIAAGSIVPPAAPTPGVAHSGYSGCSQTETAVAGLPSGLAGHYHYFANGEPVSLKGNELQNMPDGSLGFGAQYTHPFQNGFSLVTRFDGYWQTDMWGTIFNENPIDKIQSYFIANMQMQLNAPGGKWFVRAFANNLFDKTYVTGMYVSDPATGLFTNEFVGQPRTFGAAIGAKF